MSQLNIDNIADVAGTGAPDFAAMPSVAGAPVVASGSNSDGEWTQWADGTQHVTHKLPITFSGTPAGTATWTYPAAFIAEADSFNGTCVGTTRIFVASNDLGVATSIAVTGRHHLDTNISATHDFALHATGRWK